MPRIGRASLLALAALALAVRCPSQCTAPQWSAFPGTPTSTEALASHGGDLYVCGEFTSVGAVPASGIARWDGAAWHGLGAGLVGYSGCCHQVWCLASFNGDVVAGGDFVQAGGQFAGNVARWNGSAWNTFAWGVQGGVKALTTFNGELYAGGSFQTANFMPMNYVARWDGAAWQWLAGGMNAAVEALCVYNGELYAGGSFNYAGGFPCANIARWNGLYWQPLGTGTAGTVRALTVYNGELIVAGNFPSAGGLPAPSIARWNGATWSSFPMVGNNAVAALGTYGGDLYVASTLWALPTGLTPGIARWTGSAWEAVGAGVQAPNLGYANGIHSFAVHRGSLVVAGLITTAGGLASPDLARWGPLLPLLSITQPGPGSIQINDAWLVPGHEYYNLGSPDLCPGGAGTGPYGGLCTNDPTALWQQITMPVGAAPFHFLAAGTTASFGPYALPPGFAFDAISADVTSGAICLSEAIRYTVQ